MEKEGKVQHCRGLGQGGALRTGRGVNPAGQRRFWQVRHHCNCFRRSRPDSENPAPSRSPCTHADPNVLWDPGRHLLEVGSSPVLLVLPPKLHPCGCSPPAHPSGSEKSIYLQAEHGVCISSELRILNCLHPPEVIPAQVHTGGARITIVSFLSPHLPEPKSHFLDSSIFLLSGF